MLSSTFLNEMKQIQKNNEYNIKLLIEIDLIKKNYIKEYYKRNSQKTIKMLLSHSEQIDIIVDKKRNKLHKILNEIENIKNINDLEILLKKIKLNNSFYDIFNKKSLNKIKITEQKIKDILIMSNFGMINRTILSKFPPYMINDDLMLFFLQEFISSIYRFDINYNGKLSTFISNRFRNTINVTYQKYSPKIISTDGFSKLRFTKKELDLKNINWNNIKKNILSFVDNFDLINNIDYNNHYHFIILFNAVVKNSKIIVINEQKYYCKNFVSNFINELNNNIDKDILIKIDNISNGKITNRFLLLRYYLTNEIPSIFNDNLIKKKESCSLKDDNINNLQESNKEDYFSNEFIYKEKEIELNKKYLLICLIKESVFKTNIELYNKFSTLEKIKIKQCFLSYLNLNLNKNKNVNKNELNNIIKEILSIIKNNEEKIEILNSFNDLVNLKPLKKKDLKRLNEYFNVDEKEKTKFLSDIFTKKEINE